MVRACTTGRPTGRATRAKTHDCQRRLSRLPIVIGVGDVGAGSGWSCRWCWWSDRRLNEKEEMRVGERERKKEKKKKVFSFSGFRNPILYSLQFFKMKSHFCVF